MLRWGVVGRGMVCRPRASRRAAEASDQRVRDKAIRGLVPAGGRRLVCLLFILLISLFIVAISFLPRLLSRLSGVSTALHFLAAVINLMLYTLASGAIVN